MFDWLISFIRPKVEGKDMRVYESKQNQSSFADFQPTSRKLVIEDAFGISGRGTVVTGKVQDGTFTEGDAVKIYNERGEIVFEDQIRDIEKFRSKTKTAKTGDNVGFVMKSLPKELAIRGYVIS